MAQVVETLMPSKNTPRWDIRALGQIDVAPAYLVLVVVLLVMAVLHPNLLRLRILFTFIKEAAPLGLAVLGQLMVMRVRSIDLSVGGVFLITNYLLTSGALGGQPIPVEVLVSLLFGVLIGCVNGVLVAYVRASAVIVTIGVATVLTGLVLYLSSGRPPGSVPDALRAISNVRIHMVPIPVIIWAVMAILVSILMRKLIFGRFVAAVGSNPRAAHLSGLPVPRVVMASHVMSGFLAAIGGVLFTAALGVGSVNFGPDIMMNSVAATILGGVTFGSGRGGVMGPCAGVLAFGLLFPLLTIFGVQEPAKLIIQGLVIASAAIIYGLKTR